jgi:endogenous inhibitor of DNA gyrase (YacG/DUF329 family)
MAIEVKQQTTYTVKCDSCEKVLEWVQENPETMPDDAFRLITLVLMGRDEKNGKKVFCSKHCTLKFFNDYVPAKSPKELTAEMQAQKAAVPASEPATEPNLPAEKFADVVQFPDKEPIAYA